MNKDLAIAKRVLRDSRWEPQEIASTAKGLARAVIRQHEEIRHLRESLRRASRSVALLPIQSMLREREPWLYEEPK